MKEQEIKNISIDAADGAVKKYFAELCGMAESPSIIHYGPYTLYGATNKELLYYKDISKVIKFICNEEIKSALLVCNAEINSLRRENDDLKWRITLLEERVKGK